MGAVTALNVAAPGNAPMPAGSEHSEGPDRLQAGASGPEVRRRRRRWPTPAGAALRSAVVPGWGQWAAGRRWRGALILAVGVLLVLVAIATVLAAIRAFVPLPGLLGQLIAQIGDLPLRLMERLLTTDWGVVWRGAIGANVLLAIIRAAVAIDAARCARLHNVPGGGLAAAGALIVLATPHVGLVGAGLAARPLLNQVLVTAPLPSGPAAVSQPVPGTPVEVDTGRPVWDGQSRLNVLLMGVDRRPQETAERQRGNSDTLLVVSIDPASQSAALISIPRDLYLQIPGVGLEKINAAYREVGPDLSVRVVSELVGQPVHRWASIDINAFARTIDAVGGVVVDVERPIRDDEYPNEDYSVRRIYLPSGLQWLTGEQALWYARSRRGSTDFDRSARQQALLLSMKERAKDRRTLAMVPALIGSLADAVQTDLAPREALALVRLGGSTDFRSARLVLTPPTYGRELIRPNLYAIEPNVTRIRSAVAETFSARAGPLSRDGGGSPDGTSNPPAQGGDGPVVAVGEAKEDAPSEMDIP